MSDVTVPLEGFGSQGWGDSAWGIGNVSFVATGSVGSVTIVATADVQGGQLRKALAEQGQVLVVQSVAQRKVEGCKGLHPCSQSERRCLESLCPFHR